MQVLCCPLCKAPLIKYENIYKCNSNHCFDIAKEGYVNLIIGSKPGDSIGDNKAMAKNRQLFLSKNYYAKLRDKVTETVKTLTPQNSTILDICCGEGYYTSHLAENISNVCVYGFDLSKEMIRLAAKRKSKACFFVANMSKIPLTDESICTSTHMFAPFHEKEFYRILKNNGYLISVVPGARHLFGLKSAIYSSPYENDEALPMYEGLRLTDTVDLKYDITLKGNNDIQSLFSMTPYYYHTGQGDRDKLLGIDTLTTELDFKILIYRKS
ncbi:MAG: putative RNA methyltransferase [Acutalibacteraceae bacterium]